jgi:23S rRNA pseudouridine1911/1915/1917 synthase
VSAARTPGGGEPPWPARIVHLGDRFVVGDKPPGLSLATPRSAPEAAAERLRAALAPDERALLDGRDLLLVHRLDAPTSGLVLAALDADEHRRLAAEFAARRAAKTYLALVWGQPRPGAGAFDAPLGPDRGDRRKMRVDAAGRRARSEYAVLARAPHVALVALWPATGRTHQLRVHLAAAGHPIVGDDLYGGPRARGVRDPALRAALEVPRALLHAFRLELPALAPSRFEARLPPDFAAAAKAAGVGLAGAFELWHPPRPADPSRASLRTIPTVRT